MCKGGSEGSLFHVSKQEPSRCSQWRSTGTLSSQRARGTATVRGVRSPPPDLQPCIQHTLSRHRDPALLSRRSGRREQPQHRDVIQREWAAVGKSWDGKGKEEKPSSCWAPGIHVCWSVPVRAGTSELPQEAQSALPIARGLAATPLLPGEKLG